MKPAIVILYIWMALLTGWAVATDIRLPQRINAKHKAMIGYMESTRLETEKILDMLERIPTKRQ